MNDQIRVPTVRLIGADGSQLGVVPTPRALQLAQSEGWDLVEIAPNATPPVAKILDFGKYRYEEQQKAKDAKKKQKAVTWKEIRMAPKIDDHDIETKIKAAQRFLDEGDKLKVTVRFRGREMAHPDRGRALLLAVGDKLKDHGVIERMPLLEGRQMIMVMNPVRAPQVQNAPSGGPAVVGGPAGASVPATNSPAPSAPRPAALVPQAQRPPAPTPPPAQTPSAAPTRPAPARPATGNRVH
ncbi:MAG TPA: translation initiation factor IF-3 [Candidatus Limnocylindria bacterium]|nr:translation initiation factor IF-3 [Candidatus Limnocylindria bacterium]